MSEIPLPLSNPPNEPEAPSQAKPTSRMRFAWWGWVLIAALVAVLIWYLTVPHPV